MIAGLPIWVIYDHPADYPDSFVARLWHGETPTARVIVEAKLMTIRVKLSRMGLYPLDRKAGDDPKIVECWL